MCRIAGFWEPGPLGDDAEDVVVRMRDALAYGGPDDAGLYLDRAAGMALGHRRLAVLDLSAAGHQPMRFGPWVLVFNGEVYNFAEIRRGLETEGYAFETRTDTEVILKAFDRWGTAAVERFRGMYAFALWNESERQLHLCRDRVGIKPLYWYQHRGRFMFASELKALHYHPAFDRTLDKEAVSLFLRQGYVHAPSSIFQRVKKLKPGTVLTVHSDGRLDERRYWRVEDVYANASVRRGSEPELLEELEARLLDSFRLRMVSDVPVGLFLSGGIDSSTVTAILQRALASPVKTFTIGFETPEYDEAPFGRQVAEHLGTDHTELTCTEDDFRSLVGSLSEVYDEPYGDSSAIPTQLVSRLAREQVTVALSGDGGDELFGGYDRYEIARNWHRRLEQVPGVARSLIHRGLGAVDPTLLARLAPRLPVLKNYRGVDEKLVKLRNVMTADGLLEFFDLSSTYLTRAQMAELSPHWRDRHVGGLEPDDERVVGYLGALDVATYLEGDILTKVDRASMRVALEAREPFLDHHVIELAMALPDTMKIRGNQKKYLLRQLLAKYLPRELIDRPKQGFAIPIRRWLLSARDELAALSRDRGFLDAFEIRGPGVAATVDRFERSKGSSSAQVVWFLFVLHNWYRRWLA